MSTSPPVPPANDHDPLAHALAALRRIPLPEGPSEPAITTSS